MRKKKSDWQWQSLTRRVRLHSVSRRVDVILLFLARRLLFFLFPPPPLSLLLILLQRKRWERETPRWSLYIVEFLLRLSAIVHFRHSLSPFLELHSDQSVETALISISKASRWWNAWIDTSVPIVIQSRQGIQLMRTRATIEENMNYIHLMNDRQVISQKRTMALLRIILRAHQNQGWGE